MDLQPERLGAARDALAPAQAVLDAARIRLRPRVMTTVTTMVGFLPLVLNLEETGQVCDYIRHGGDRRRFLARFGKAAWWRRPCTRPTGRA